MADPDPGSASDFSEPDLVLEAEDDDQLDPTYTPEDIERIQNDAINADNAANAVTQVPPAANKKKRKFNKDLKAEVWKYFTKGVEQDDGFYDAVCNFCGETYQMGNSRGTGSLRHHNSFGCKKRPRNSRDKLQKMLNMTTVALAGETKVVVWKFDQTLCRKNFAIMVIVHEYPFNCVNHHYLKVFLSELQPEFKLVSRNTLRKDCIGIYEEERSLLYEELGKLHCKVSFTSDLWTSNSGDRGFMALTCHYIDDSWRIRKRLINFAPLPSPHTGKNIAEAFFSMLVMWNLDKKGFSLVLDNASSNDACIRELLSGPMSDNLPVNGEVFHQRCGCHILNLVVDAGLSVVGDQISKVRETMKFLRHSQARMERFQLAASQAKVPFKKPAWDVATRWNSTFLMLELALYLKPAIDRYCTLDKNYTKSMQLNNNDWLGVEALMDCLNVFYSATLKFSGTKYATLNLFFTEFCHVFVNIRSMEKSKFSFIIMMAGKMLPKWERYWTSANTLLAIACVLDPRCKLTAVEYYYKLIYPQEHEWYVKNLKGCINALFDEYFKAYSLQQNQGESSQAQSQSQSSQASGASSSGTGSSTVNDIRAGLKSLLAEKHTAEPLKSELEQYLTEPLDATALDASFDILAWWKLKVTVYPVMARLARDILAVPASTVASESTFSTSGRTLSTVRNSLNNESLQALICAQDWLRCKVPGNGGEVDATATLWASAEATLDDDTICGSHQA